MVLQHDRTAPGRQAIQRTARVLDRDLDVVVNLDSVVKHRDPGILGLLTGLVKARSPEGDVIRVPAISPAG